MNLPVIVFGLDDFGKRHIFSCGSNLDSHTVSNISLGDDDDVTTFDAGNPIILTPTILTFDCPDIAFLYRRLLGVLLWFRFGLR